MVNLAFPIETASLRGLTFLDWPRNGVAFTRAVELAAAAAIVVVEKWYVCEKSCEKMGQILSEGERWEWVVKIACVGNCGSSSF